MTAVSQTSAIPVSKDSALSARLKDAFAAAILTVLLCVPIVLLRADSDNNGVLHATPRPGAVAIFALLAFFGRLAALNFSASATKEARTGALVPEAVRTAASKYLPAIGLVVLFLYPFAILSA